jgi:hypothetical protein
VCVCVSCAYVCVRMVGTHKKHTKNTQVCVCALRVRVWPYGTHKKHKERTKNALQRVCVCACASEENGHVNKTAATCSCSTQTRKTKPYSLNPKLGTQRWACMRDEGVFSHIYRGVLVYTEGVLMYIEGVLMYIEGVRVCDRVKERRVEKVFSCT